MLAKWRASSVVAVLVAVPLLTVFSSGAACAAPQANQERLRRVKSWAYQLQGKGEAELDVEALAKSSYELLVVDFAPGATPLTRKQVRRLKCRPDGKRRLVLAYMSIGEAEEYRYYWRPSWKRKPPAFLVAENAAWAGNFKVRYWLPEWQRIILGDAASKQAGYLDRIIEAGFDGVYLDIVDAFEYFGPGGEAAERKSAASDMAGFVTAIASHARVVRRRPGFLVVPQNGANILDEIAAAEQKRYLATVDAIGAEDTFFYGDREENNPLDMQRDTIAALERFRDAGKPVLAVDYLTDRKKAGQFSALARKHGFIPYVATRDLDRLVVQPE